MRGIDPRTSRMLSERSTIWATSPSCWFVSSLQSFMQTILEVSLPLLAFDLLAITHFFSSSSSQIPNSHFVERLKRTTQTTSLLHPQPPYPSTAPNFTTHLSTIKNKPHDRTPRPTNFIIKFWRGKKKIWNLLHGSNGSFLTHVLVNSFDVCVFYLLFSQHL